MNNLSDLQLTNNELLLPGERLLVQCRDSFARNWSKASGSKKSWAPGAPQVPGLRSSPWPLLAWLIGSHSVLNSNVCRPRTQVPCHGWFFSPCLRPKPECLAPTCLTRFCVDVSRMLARSLILTSVGISSGMEYLLGFYQPSPNVCVCSALVAVLITPGHLPPWNASLAFYLLGWASHSHQSPFLVQHEMDWSVTLPHTVAGIYLESVLPQFPGCLGPLVGQMWFYIALGIPSTGPLFHCPTHQCWSLP